MRSEAALVALLPLAACLPLHETVRDEDLVLRAFDAEVVRNPPRFAATTRSSETELQITLLAITECTHGRREVVARARSTQRHTSTWIHASLYALGVLGGAAGAGLILDSRAATPDDRVAGVGSSLDDGRNIGIGVAAAGGALLLVAIGSSARATDQREILGNQERAVAGSGRKTECDRGPAVGEQLGLVVRPDGAARLHVPLGRTDAGGRLLVSWSQLGTALPAARAATAELVVGAAEVSVAQVELPSFVDPERDWAIALETDTFEAYRAYRERNPTSLHAAEAIEKGRIAHAKAAQIRFDAAVSAGELERATEALVALKTFGDPAAVEAAQARLTTLGGARAAQSTRAALLQAMAELDRTDDATKPLADARLAIETIRAQSPELVEAAESDLRTARDRMATRLVRAAQVALDGRDFARADRLYASAADAANDPRTVKKAREATRAAAIRTLRDEARALARAKQYAEAIALAAVVVPPDPALARDQASWRAAAQRVASSEEAAERARLAAEAERASREARRQADQEARDRARLAAEQRASERSAKVEQARLAAEQQARARADKIEQERRDRAAKAEQDRIAGEAERQRKLAAEQAAAAEQKRREDEARRTAAAAKLDGAIARAQRPATPATVQLELPLKYVKDDVLARLPVPKNCKATIAQFTGRSCPTCEARPMSRVDMTCGALGFAFVRDRQHVWVTCTASTMACPDCLAAAQSALAAFETPKDKLRVAQACPKSR